MMRCATDTLIRVIEKEPLSMNKIFLYFCAAGVLFLCGCGKKAPKADPALLEKLKQEVKCTQCRVSSPLEKYERINQVLGRCPACRKVINVRAATDKGKKR